MPTKKKRPPRVAAFAEKSGGKSALTTGMAAVAAEDGMSVLVIDLDPRASATDELDVEMDDEALTVGDIMYLDPEDPVDATGLASEVIRPAGESWSKNILVIPADRNLANREADLTPGWERRLGDSLVGVEEDFDLILLDVRQATGGKVGTSALMTSDIVLLNTTLDKEGLLGTVEALKTLRIVLAGANRDLRLAGVVRNRVELTTSKKNPEPHPKTLLARDIDRDIAELELFKGVPLPIVPGYIPEKVARQMSRHASVPITAVIDERPEAKELVTAYRNVLNFTLEFARKEGF